jgi:hypothetical protein
MVHRFLIVVSVLMVTVNVVAQQNVKIEKKEFRTSKPGYETAWKSIEKGDSYYDAGSAYYKLAITDYRIALLYNSENAELNYKLGVCFLYSQNKAEALDYFLKALKLNHLVSPDILLLTGRAYQYNGRFTEAVGKYTEYIESYPKMKTEIMARVRRYIDESNSGMLNVADTARIEITNPGDTINSKYDDYSPVFNRDGSFLYFASRRPGPDEPSDIAAEMIADENIYFAAIKGHKTDFAMLLEGKINTEFSEAPLFLTPEGDRFYIYGGYVGEGDILVSELKDNTWRIPMALRTGINSFSAETSVTISPSGEEMVFVSARKSGAGGKDIYIVNKDKKSWTDPLNLGMINSSEDEESVCFSRTGDTLWFSSKGHSTIGGFDIFFSSRMADGSWGAPVNAGIPINTVYDDLYFVPSRTDDSVFFFVSNRPGGLGGLDIFKGRLLPALPDISNDTSSKLNTPPDTSLIKRRH